MDEIEYHPLNTMSKLLGHMDLIKLINFLHNLYVLFYYKNKEIILFLLYLLFETNLNY